MASAAERAPKQRRRRRDLSKPPPHRLKRKAADEKGAVEEKRKRDEEKKKKRKKREKRLQGENEGKENVEAAAEEEGGVGGGEVASVSASSSFLLSTAPTSQQLQFFLKQFESANKFRISSLELEAVKGTCIAKLSEGMNQDVDNFSKHMKDVFGPSWEEVLCKGKLVEGKVDAGNPALLVVSISALRSLELLRGLRPLTKECKPAKLFAKHIKVDDQVALLKNRVNVASGTPNRIKKLIDMEALGVSRLSVVVLDMHKDAKGFSLFTLPQVRDEFWDLYRSHFHQRLIQGELRICFYGPISASDFKKDPGER